MRGVEALGVQGRAQCRACSQPAPWEGRPPARECIFQTWQYLRVKPPHSERRRALALPIFVTTTGPAINQAKQGPHQSVVSVSPQKRFLGQTLFFVFLVFSRFSSCNKSKIQDSFLTDN